MIQCYMCITVCIERCFWIFCLHQCEIKVFSISTSVILQSCQSNCLWCFSIFKRYGSCQVDIVYSLFCPCWLCWISNSNFSMWTCSTCNFNIICSAIQQITFFLFHTEDTGTICIPDLTDTKCLWSSHKFDGMLSICKFFRRIQQGSHFSWSLFCTYRINFCSINVNVHVSMIWISCSNNPCFCSCKFKAGCYTCISPCRTLCCTIFICFECPVTFSCCLTDSYLFQVSRKYSTSWWLYFESFCCFVYAYITDLRCCFCPCDIDTYCGSFYCFTAAQTLCRNRSSFSEIMPSSCYVFIFYCERRNRLSFLDIFLDRNNIEFLNTIQINLQTSCCLTIFRCPVCFIICLTFRNRINYFTCRKFFGISPYRSCTCCYTFFFGKVLIKGFLNVASKLFKTV